MSCALPYGRGTRIPGLLGVGNYLSNHFAMHACLARIRMVVELASPVYLALIVI